MRKLTTIIIGASIAALSLMGCDATASTVPTQSIQTVPYMEEDESPYAGKYGGELITYENGIACYSDQTCTDGAQWWDD